MTGRRRGGERGDPVTPYLGPRFAKAQERKMLIRLVLGPHQPPQTRAGGGDPVTPYTPSGAPPHSTSSDLVRDRS